MKLKELRKLPQDELEGLYDDAAEHTMSGLSLYRDEILIQINTTGAAFAFRDTITPVPGRILSPFVFITESVCLAT